MRRKIDIRNRPLFAAALHRACLWLVLILILAACNTTRYLSEGQTFYNGADIQFSTTQRIGGKKTLKRDLEGYLRPEPNGKLFGGRPEVWFYFKGGENARGLKKFMRERLGKPPVLLQDVQPDRVAKMLAAQTNNHGYFRSSAKYEIKTNRKKKESKIIYTVFLQPPYHLREVHYPTPRDSVYARILRTLRDESLLEPGQRFELARLQAEQERIEREVKNFGLYFFDDRYLIFEADSTVGKKQVDLDLRLEPGVPERARKIYRLNEITIFPNYTLETDTARAGVDTVQVGGYKYVLQTTNFRPEVITEVINFERGKIYRKEDQEITLGHLMDLGAFKYANVRFEEVALDTPLLNASIFLTPVKRKSIRAEMQAVSKSNNFVGPGVSSTYTDRNVFKGSELFELNVNSSYEVQMNRRIGTPLNAFEFGLEGVLTIPRFIAPILDIDYHSRRFLPKTIFRVGYNLQSRVGFFRLNSFHANYGFIWRENLVKTHELYPVDINYVHTDRRSPDFNVLLERNRLLANSFEDQFIIGSRYSYTINTQFQQNLLDAFQERTFKTHSIYFNGRADVAGNLLNTIQRQAIRDQDVPFQIFGAAYSQYVKGDADFRYYWQPDIRNKIAMRIMTGVGYAFSNSATLPYVKQYAIGGTNSIRAFPARSIGPGTYNFRTDSTRQAGLFFIDQRGDIKLETNVEYRFDIYRFLKGAVFVDAGNIWTWREDVDRPGSQFSRREFIDELAVGTGFGLRLDFNFFVLRFDTAFPLRRPYLLEGERWVIRQIDVLDRNWRRDNIILNIAIGYPF